MKKTLLALSVVASTLAAAPAMAGGIGNNAITPSVTFGDGQSTFGINTKFGVADNVSLRPFIAFPSGATSFGSSITYDFDLRQSATPITPFLGVGVDFTSANNGGGSITTGFATAGVDFNVTKQFALLGAVEIPFNSGGSSVILGAGFRF